MKLIDYLHVVRRRWLIIVLAAAVGGALAAAYASTIRPEYTATSRVYITMATGTSVDDSYHGALAAQQRVTSYADLVASSNVAQRVVADLSLPMSPAELQSKIKSSFPPSTALIDVSVTDGNPERAKLLTDKVVAQFRRLADELETTVDGAAPAARITVVDPAAVPTEPVGLKPHRVILLGLLAGLAVGCLAALARDRLDRRLRTSNDLDAVLPVPTLGIIDIGEPGAEGEMRRLRARITEVHGEAMSLLITSFSSDSEPGIAIDLCQVLADAGRRVVLVDADTTGRGSSDLLQIPSGYGIAELLRSNSSPAKALVARADLGISVMPLGTADWRTSDLLASDRFADIVMELRSMFDHVVVETAPVAAAADALAVSARCDAALAIVELGTTTSTQVRGAFDTFRQGGAGLLGTVAVSRSHGSWFMRQLRRLRRGTQPDRGYVGIHRHDDATKAGSLHHDPLAVQTVEVAVHENGDGGGGKSVTISGTQRG
jgi:capsular polysaccharide biosynthesis protein